MSHLPYQTISLPRVNDPRGNLSFIQRGRGLPFEIRRVYWIYDVPGGKVRHGRALRATDEMIVALSGSFDVVIDDGSGRRQSVHLNRSYNAVHVPPMCWREIENFSTNSVALVLASSEYDEADYIRHYDAFVAEKAQETHKADIKETLQPATPQADRHGESDISRCGLRELPRHMDPNGSLTEVENNGTAPLEVRRVFYLYDVPAGSERGGHSHRSTRQLIVAASGSFKVTLDDGHRRETFTLERPFQALYVEPGVWDTLHDFSGGAVCLVLASAEYDEADYCRDYAEFKRLTSGKETQNPVRTYKFLDLATANAPYMDELKEAAARVIDSGWYIGGKEVERLEQTLCRLSGTPHAIGVSNGLDALRLILRGYIELDRLRPGDEVIVAANTYVASVLAITDMGLKPVLVEPDPETHNLDTELVEGAITPRTRAIMAVHLYGRACWDATLAQTARRHGLLVIEDNAQAIGATAEAPGLYGVHATGGLGDAAAYSFYPTKNIGALGDAGAVTTHDDALARAVRALRNYGSDRRYHNIYTGYNCRLDPMQAAMLNVKMGHLDEETDLRRAVVRVYTETIDNPLVTKLKADDLERSVWHQYVVRVTDRDRFRQYLSAHGVETDVHYATPPHRQPCYSEYADSELPVTERLAAEVVSLPVSRCTTVDDAREIARIINSYC